MTQLYVYGKAFDRFEEITIKAKIDSALIDKAFALTDENEIDDWLEKSDELQQLTSTLHLILGITQANSYQSEQKEEMKKCWEEDGKFHLWMEEFSFGVAKTAKEAKLEWLKNESDDGDEW